MLYSTYRALRSFIHRVSEKKQAKLFLL